MRITRSRSLITKFYTIGGQILEQMNQAKYLRVILSDELKWSPHIKSGTTSANSTLGFIRRNLKQCLKDLMELAYLSLVRSKLEYAASVWDPHYTSDANKWEQSNVEQRVSCVITTAPTAVSLKCWVILGGSSSRTDGNIFALHYFIK